MMKKNDKLETPSWVHIPTSMSGHSIKRVPFQLALDVIQLHVEAQEKELERLKQVCRVQLA